MNIGGFQKLTLLDYPGLMACIVFTPGCNFRCPFCHNSGLVLPEQLTSPVPETEVLDYLKMRRGLLEGVVITGGEPLLHGELGDFIKRVRALGYKIKLDTNGSFPDRLQELIRAGLIDYVAMDIKQAPRRYEAAAGVPSDRVVPLIEQSLRYLRSSGIPFELRTTVVRGIHTAQDVVALARWIAGPQPYYLQSYVDSGHVISPERLSAFSPEELSEMLEHVRAYCPNAAVKR